MKTAAFGLLAPAGFTFVASLVIGYAPAAEAKAQKFVCDNAGGVPVTMAIMPNGERIPFIRWKSNVFLAFSPVPTTLAIAGVLNVYNKQRWAPIARSLRSHIHSLSGHKLGKEHSR
jgi:hypothetical protein